MGTDELVLKIPTAASSKVMPGSPSPPAASSPSTSSSGKPLTHSRESSGASVKFVSAHHHHYNNHKGKHRGGGGRHRRESSGGGSSDGESHVVILGTAGESDDHLLAVSDRLSHDGGDKDDRLSPDSSAEVDMDENDGSGEG
jgi:hypothetical protein